VVTPTAWYLTHSFVIIHIALNCCPQWTSTLIFVPTFPIVSYYAAVQTATLMYSVQQFDHLPVLCCRGFVLGLQPEMTSYLWSRMVVCGISRCGLWSAWELRNVVNHGICYQNVCPSVRPSVCHVFNPHPLFYYSTCATLRGPLSNRWAVIVVINVVLNSQQ